MFWWWFGLGAYGLLMFALGWVVGFGLGGATILNTAEFLADAEKEIQS